MRVITYLGVTVLSIFIQFCVMDLIQDKIILKEKGDVNVTHKKKVATDLLKNISSKPHALYYRTHMSKSSKGSAALTSFTTEKIFSNTSTPAVGLETTDISTTIFDILYDENVSTTETTETYFTTTEFDNVTEITFFETRNKTDVQNAVPKISFSKHCDCNLLYKICDTNCCCDQDCTSEDYKYFQCEEKNNDKMYNDRCTSYLHDSNFNYGSGMLDDLFCVAKTNLPERRNIKTPNLENIGEYNKWKKVTQKQILFEFKKTIYNHSDPIWILKNGTIYHLDFPIPTINNYCTDRAPVVFLKQEKVQCIVKLKDLEMFHISRASEESMVVSATEKTFNSTGLNCTNLHCINWTVLACDNGICTNYNKSLNEASCTEIACKNVALKIDYIFHYYDFKITNATIKLHIQNISNLLPFLSQEINVKFIMGNKSLDNVIEFSGNPGYVFNLPVIISEEKRNFTANFFNNTLQNRMFYPENQNGMCVLSNSSQNSVKFGVNKRIKCRYVHTNKIVLNNTNLCQNFQDNIDNLLGINKVIHISPFGNPYGVPDEKWVNLPEFTREEPVYGTYSDNVSKLHCYNIVNSISVIFIYANVDEQEFTNQNKILLTRYETAASNISFSIENISTVITIDIIFVDATKPNVYVYAGSPHINIHLPGDFFFPFKPNKCLHLSNSVIVTIICCIIAFLNKITLE